MNQSPNKNSLLWKLPSYVDKWRLFPRIFISGYVYIIIKVTEWFLALPDPSAAQAGFASAVFGVGAAWFGIYVNKSDAKSDS